MALTGHQSIANYIGIEWVNIIFMSKKDKSKITYLKQNTALKFICFSNVARNAPCCS